jgi:hypothetical protein
MMPPTISRRILLAVATTGATVSLGESLSFGWSVSTNSGTDGDLVALCSELACPKPVGKACLLALPPSERGLPFLISALLPHDRAPGEGGPPLRPLAQWIRERIRADFQEGSVLAVNGWLLAITEGRLYAMAALLSEVGGRGASTKNAAELTGSTVNQPNVA